MHFFCALQIGVSVGFSLWVYLTILLACLFSDLADWLGVGEIGLFNFKPSVRPVPLEVHIQASGLIASSQL